MVLKTVAYRADLLSIAINGNKGITNIAPPHPGVSPKKEPIIGWIF